MRFGSDPDLLHDVDLAVVGPFLHGDREHPDRRPGAARAGQPGAHFVETISPAWPLRDDPARGVMLPAPVARSGWRLPARFDDQAPAIKPQVAGPAGGIILQLLVEPSLLVEGGFVAPFAKVERTAVELVAPHHSRARWTPDRARVSRVGDREGGLGGKREDGTEHRSSLLRNGGWAFNRDKDFWQHAPVRRASVTFRR